MSTLSQLETQLNSHDAGKRRDALLALSSGHMDAVSEASANVNMHCHSFFSYNAEGFSPSRIAWEARKAGLTAAGLCDFDVLDGLEEFLEAGFLLGLRATVNMETRAFVKEQAELDINSPGEPGVAYVMGAGFARKPGVNSEAGKGLREYAVQAAARNRNLVARINPHVPDIAIDYESDVLALTPGGTPTERHIIRAYINKASDAFPASSAAAEFWARILEVSLDEAGQWLADVPVLEEKVRARLAKRGGLGYEQPSMNTFPLVDDFIRWVLSCEAIPMTTWLDGTSSGESHPGVLLEMMKAKGAPALNIIPDRNWNISDPSMRDIKVRKLAEMVAAADAMDIPVNIGTEMNKRGLPFSDNLAGDALSAHKGSFVRGAKIVVGHTLLTRFCDFPYVGESADAAFRSAREKNVFFEKIGGLPPLDKARARSLAEMGPEKAFARFREEAL